MVSTLITWHKRLGHTNFSSLKAFLHYFEILFVDNSKDYICDSCYKAKATKVYNRAPQKCAQQPYQFVYIDFVGSINLVGFSGKQYFLTFTDDCTRLTQTYTGNKKSNWLKCLKVYYSLCRIRFKEEHPIERFGSDYCAELQSHKANEWMQKNGITLEPLPPYSQEQNSVSERLRKTLIDMTRSTILEGNIDNKLWPELVIAITYIKNSRPTRVLANNQSPHEAHFHKKADLSYLQILGSNVYILLHKEKPSMNLEKWASQVLRGILVGFDGHTIYRVHIKDQNRVIWVKNPRIFEDYKSKGSIELPNYFESLSIFQGFFYTDNNNEKQELLILRTSQKVKTQKRKIN